MGEFVDGKERNDDEMTCGRDKKSFFQDGCIGHGVGEVSIPTRTVAVYVMGQWFYGCGPVVSSEGQKGLERASESVATRCITNNPPSRSGEYARCGMACDHFTSTTVTFQVYPAVLFPSVRVMANGWIYPPYNRLFWVPQHHGL